MKIYRSVNPVGEMRDLYCRLAFASDEDRKRFAMGDHFRGTPLSPELQRPYQVARSTEFPGGDTAPLGDRQAIGFESDPMAVSRRALDALLPHIGLAVQVVPLVFDEGEYSLLNIVNVIDALDLEKSEKTFYRADGTLKDVVRHVFRPDVVHDQFIFKIPQAPRRAFVTDRFVEVVQSAGLTGFQFEELWNDEPATQEAGA